MTRTWLSGLRDVAHGSTGSETLNILRQRPRADAAEWKNYVAH